jgi:hypothetical protein
MVFATRRGMCGQRPDAFGGGAGWEDQMSMVGSLLERVLEPGDWQLAMLAGPGRGVLSPTPPDALSTWRGPTRAQLGDLDLDRIAADIVERYPDEAYPAVVIGANHGSVAYLAALLGAPWLPSGLDVPVDDGPDGLDGLDPHEVLHDTGALGRQLRTRFPGTAVSRRFPRGRLRLTWGALPPAYRRFLAERVRPGGTVLVVRDVCPARVLRDGPDGSIQLELDPLDPLGPLGPLGGPADVVESWRSGTATLARPGFAAGALRFARQHKLAGSQLLFNEPDLLSTLVADTTRTLLRDLAVPDSWLVVQHGCRIDVRPLADGAVPYWCAGAGVDEATTVECWLAGSPPFQHIDLVLEPFTDPRAPSMLGWMSACRFAAVSAAVDLRDGPATSWPTSAPPRPDRLDRMPYAPAEEVFARLAVLASRSGLLLT